MKRHVRALTPHFAGVVLLLPPIMGCAPEADEKSEISRPVPSRGAASRTISLGLVVSNSSSNLAAGSRLGADEVQRTARMLGRDLTVSERTTSARGTLKDAMNSLASSGVSAIVVAVAPEYCAELADAAGRSSVPLMNASCGDDGLRRGQCRRNVFHVSSSNAMLDDARRLHAKSAGATGVTYSAWDSTLERFGAGQLSERFASRYKRGMDADAWAGWLAMKVLGEAALRGNSQAIDAFLRSEAAQFDGHKGVRLSFRTWDNQLRQPLYAISRSASVAQVPDDRGSERSSRDLLDMIGDGANESTCRMSQ